MIWQQAFSQLPRCRSAPLSTGAQNNAAGVVASGGNAIVTRTSGPYGGPSEFATVACQGYTVACQGDTVACQG